MHLRRIFVLTVLSYVTALPSDINLGVALRGCDVEACDMEVRICLVGRTECQDGGD